MGYNFTFKVWYIVSAEEIKGQSFSSAGFHFFNLSDQFHNLFNPLQKSIHSRVLFSLEESCIKERHQLSYSPRPKD